LAGFAMLISSGMGEKGLVCGAYIAQNKDYAATIEQYESLCDVKNSIYLVNVVNDFPKNEVLECYAQNKIPMLLLSDRYNMGMVAQLAEKAGEYNLPLFLCINCNSDVDFYKYCVDMFRIKAPKTKFVQAVEMNESNYTFAGVDYVDYLAINATIGAQCCDYGILQAEIEQADVPVMINLAVSHYMEETHSYYYYDKMKTLNYIYGLKEIENDKLYGINYVNVDYDGQRFDVYEDEKLRKIYCGVVCRWGDDEVKLSNLY
jgi:hypothetical protein